MENGQVSDEDAEKFRQEGREEILDWMVQQEILNYSRHDKIYFKWDWKKEFLTVLPWKRKSDES